MLKAPLSIIAVAGFGRSLEMDNFKTPSSDVVASETVLEEQFFNIFRNKVRRASRYVKFANLAALQCLRKIDPQYLQKQRIGLFLGTGLGNTPDVVKFTSEIFASRGNAVGPAHFVNTVSNAGLFYVARSLERECSTTVVSQENLSFEAALLTAGLALERREIDLAIVGGVDVCLAPKELSFERMGTRGTNVESIGEGSAFVALTQNYSEGISPLAHLNSVGVRMVPGSGVSAMEKFLPAVMGSKIGFSCGIDQRVDGLNEIASHFQAEPFEYRNLSGDYPTASAFAFCKFVSDREEGVFRQLWHANVHHEGLAGYFNLSLDC